MSQDDTPAPEGQTPEPVEPKAEDAPKATESFDADYVKSLRAEAAKYRVEAQEAKAKAQEYEDANKSELEKAQAKLAKAEQAAQENQAKLLRYEIGTEKEVPPKLLPLLTGTSREELESQAQLILDNVKTQDAPPDFDGGPRDPAPEPKSPELAHNASLLEVLGIPPKN